MKLSAIIDGLQALLQMVGDIDVAAQEVVPEKPFSDLDALRAEIERGPLARQLAEFWADVFEAPAGREPDPEQEKARWSSWNVKKNRAGKLKSDAAFAIHKMLTNPAHGDGLRSRSAILGWGDWPYKLVIHAKGR